MSQKYLRIWIYIISLSGYLSATATPKPIADSLSRQLKAFVSAHPQTTLYVHLDKNNYSPGETIWFKAYVLSGRVIDNRVLYVRLADRDKHVIRQLQFPMYDIRSNGDMPVPDSLQDGQYYVYAYTDRMLNFDPRDVFVQAVNIKHNARHRLEADASVPDSLKLVRGSRASIVIHVKDNGELRKGLQGIYSLMDNDKVLRSGKLATNPQGETSINFTYPQLADDHSLQVHISFKDQQDYAELNLNLPHEGNGYQLQAYPEGGHLTAGLDNRLLVSLTDKQNTPVTGVQLMLTGNNSQTTIVPVVTDDKGLAMINFKPEAGSNYQFRITRQNAASGTTLPLGQEIRAKGYGLKLQRQASGSVSVSLGNTGEEGNGLLTLRCADSVVWSRQVTINPGDSLQVALPVNTLPKNVYNVALFDSSGRLMAERLFMNNIHEDYAMNIKTDAPVYGTRKKVTVQLRVTGRQGKPVATNLSMAVVEHTAITTKTYPTILNTYYYYLLEGSTAAALLEPQSFADIDRLLMAVNWRQLNWPSVLQPNQTEHKQVLIANSGGLNGYLEPLKKHKAETNELLLFSKGGITNVGVNAQLHFSIDPSLILSYRSNPWYMIQSDEFRKSYRIHYLLPEEKFDRGLTDSLAAMPRSFNTVAVFKPEILSLDKVTNLHEVKISAPTNNNGFVTDANGVLNYYSKECTDRICHWGVINCLLPGHRTDEYSEVMIPGHKYYRGVGYFIYHSNCTVPPNPNNIAIKNITKPTVFYAPDFEKIPMDDVPIGTTIYWNPNTGTLNTGLNTLSFFTSDLKGRFTIMVQGIDVHTLKPVYGMTEFEVK